MSLLKKIYSYFYFLSWKFGFWKPPDRRFLEEKILKPIETNPQVTNILFAGVESYCEHYKTFFKAKNFCTVDPNQAVARFGGKTHWVATVQDLQPGNLKFEIIILNGLIGFGLDTKAEAEAALDSCLKILSPGGFIILGFNPDRLEDMKKILNVFERRLQISEWPGVAMGTILFQFPLSDMTHQYLFYQK